MFYSIQGVPGQPSGMQPQGQVAQAPQQSMMPPGPNVMQNAPPSAMAPGGNTMGIQPGVNIPDLNNMQAQQQQKRIVWTGMKLN